MEWISLKERLPEPATKVLVAGCWGVDVAYFRPDGNFYWEYNWYARLYENKVDGVTHYMLLPPPPSEHNSDYAKCPCCGVPWNIEEHSSCDCGAFIKKRL